MKVQEYTVQVPQTVLDDLQERLARTCWPDEAMNAGWEYGSDLAYMRELIEYWRTRFDWRAQERAINELPQYRAEVDGWGIHFIHARGKGPQPLPLLITHGWPSTFLEMRKLIPLLTDPASHGGDAADAFDVVVPSLPGHGFSDRPATRGPWNIHERWIALMSGLGYERFGAQGTDMGATVTSHLAYTYPEQVIGLHLSSNLISPTPPPDPAQLSPEEQAFLKRREQWIQDEGAYIHLQGTRPQTPAYALTDSPAGLAAWIVEKLRAWSDCHGQIEWRFSKDEILTNVMLYWVTQTIGSSMRNYYQVFHHPVPISGRIDVPTAVALFPHGEDVPRAWAERTYNVQRWTRMPSGGHFAAWEEPHLLVEDIRAFFRGLRPSPELAHAGSRTSANSPG